MFTATLQINAYHEYRPQMILIKYGFNQWKSVEVLADCFMNFTQETLRSIL